MSKRKMLAVGLIMTLTLTGCGLDSLPAVFDVEEEGADFDTGNIELPQINLDDIQLPEFSLEDFSVEEFLSGEFELPEISLENFVEAYGSKGDELTEEEKDSRYKEYLMNVCQEALKKVEGIEDIDIDLESLANSEKLNVDLDYAELVGDKEELKEKVKTILEKFFAGFEGLTIDVSEE